MNFAQTATRAILLTACVMSLTACSGSRRAPADPVVVPSQTQVNQGTAQPTAYPIKP